MENDNQMNSWEQSSTTGNPQFSNGNSKIDWAGDAQRFFMEDLKEMFVHTFMRPINGVQKWLTETRSKSIVNPICMIVVAFLLASFIPFLFLLMKYGSGISFGSCIVQFGLLTTFYAIFVTIFMFIFLAIKQKPDIILAFRNSAIHVFIMTVAILVISLIVLIFGLESLAEFNLMGNIKFGGVLMLLVFVYGFSIGISGVRQVLSANTSNEKDGKDLYSWYIAPLVLILSFWLAELIVSNM